MADAYASKSNTHQRSKAYSFAKVGGRKNSHNSSSLSKHKSTALSLVKRADVSAEHNGRADQTDDLVRSNYTSNTSQEQIKVQPCPPQPIEMEPERGVFQTITNSTRYFTKDARSNHNSLS